MELFKKLTGQGSNNSLSVQEAEPRLKEFVVLDVRQPSEFQVGHIASAKLIPLDKLNQRLAELPKDKAVLCVCRSGARSGAAARQLRAAGYEAINLKGGMGAWQRAGLPVKQGAR
ncbi:MAG: rhodanese-like domain-containing protein [Chloroflexi bacterium]|nr:rhodanese-like domain-containing protein [Chloroflexota bacterium]